jgi:Zn-dependent peptidase ImmA (M78 family)
MTDKRAFTSARRLVRRSGSRDPFQIADDTGVTVLFRNDFKRQKGAFKVVARNSFIFINANLSEEMQRLVCAHELGHSVLHRSLGGRAGGLFEFEIFDIQNQCEYDANVFAATLLLDDEDVLESAREGYDVVQTARNLGTNVNLVLLKMIEMNQQGYNFRVPFKPSAGFLGRIGDDAGEL